MKNARLLLGLAVIAPTFAQADWHRSYVVEWFEPAFYYGAKEGDSAPGTDCPAGTNPDMDWRKELKTSYRTEADVEKILDPEKPMRAQVGGIRGPNKENVYEKPWSLPDPGMVGVTGKVAHGFDLDGKAKTGFMGLNGEKGVDNQYYKAAGCWMSWRGPSRASHHAKYVNDGMRDGVFSVLMVVSGSGSDWKNDNDVTVGFYFSKDKMVKDANGNIARDYSFRVNTDPRFQSIVKARTVNGAIENTERADVRLHDVETAPFFPPQLLLSNARFKFEPKADGTLFGMIGGYRPIMDYYTGWAAAGAIHELTTHVNMPAYWYALRRHADAMPDPETGQNMAISTAYHFYLQPAFAIAPNGDQAVTVAKLFEGPRLPDPPIRMQPRSPSGEGGGGGASKVYPPPPSNKRASRN
jgi:hypothetical protein